MTAERSLLAEEDWPKVLREARLTLLEEKNAGDAFRQENALNAVVESESSRPGERVSKVGTNAVLPDKMQLLRRFKYAQDEEERKEYEREAESDSCLVCMVDPPNLVILECGHLVMCLSCIEKVQRTSKVCPVCRGRITGFIQLMLEKAVPRLEAISHLEHLVLAKERAGTVASAEQILREYDKLSKMSSFASR